MITKWSFLYKFGKLVFTSSVSTTGEIAVTDAAVNSKTEKQNTN